MHPMASVGDRRELSGRKNISNSEEIVVANVA